MKHTKMKKLFAITLIALACGGAQAEVIPTPGRVDPRIRVIDYHESEVVRINTFYGVSTQIRFGEEKITSVALGDDEAWKAVVRGSSLFIKPTDQYADTNLQVMTDKRAYNFVLMIEGDPKHYKQAWKNRDLVYSLKFRYPEDEAAARKAKQDAEQQAKLSKAEAEKISSDLKLASQKSGHNLDYWVRGDSDVSPTGAYDDGRFVFLTFNNNRDIPAVYAVDENGKESLINTNIISGNTVSVQRLVPSLILRQGDKVAQVTNKSFNKNGGKDSLSGTVSDTVERNVLEAQ